MKHFQPVKGKCCITSAEYFSHFSLCSQASDKDSGENRKIEFKVKAVQFRHSDNRTENLRLLFEAVTTQQGDVFVGNIQ